MDTSGSVHISAAVTRDPPWTPMASLSSISTRSIASPTAILNGYSSTTSGESVGDCAYINDGHVKDIPEGSPERTIVLPAANVRVFGQPEGQQQQKLRTRHRKGGRQVNEDDDEVPLAELRAPPSAVSLKQRLPYHHALPPPSIDLAPHPLNGDDTLRSVTLPLNRARTYSQAAASSSGANYVTVIPSKSGLSLLARNRSQSEASVASSLARSNSQKLPRPAKSVRRPSISESGDDTALASTSGRPRLSATGGKQDHPNTRATGRPPTLVLAQPRETEEIIQDVSANFSTFSPTDTPSLTGGASGLSTTEYTNNPGGSDPRTSVYSSISSSEWDRDREREECYEKYGLPYSRSQLSLDGSYDPHDHQFHLNGHAPYPQHLYHSGFFELEHELAIHATPEPPELPELSAKEEKNFVTDNLKVLSSRDVQRLTDLSVPDGRQLSPASHRFGLGITSDHAVHTSAMNAPHDQSYSSAKICKPVAGAGSQPNDPPSLQSNARLSSMVSSLPSPSRQFASRWSTNRGSVSRRNTPSTLVSNPPCGGDEISAASTLPSQQVAVLDLTEDRARSSTLSSTAELSPQEIGSRSAAHRQSARHTSLSDVALSEKVDASFHRPSLGAAWQEVQTRTSDVADADASEELASPFGMPGGLLVQQSGRSSDTNQDTLVFDQHVRGISSSSSSTRSHAPAPIFVNGLPHLRRSSEASTVRSKNSLSAFDNTLHSATASAALATLLYAEASRAAEQDPIHSAEESLDTSLSSEPSDCRHNRHFRSTGLGIESEYLPSSLQTSKLPIAENVGQAIQLVDLGLHTIAKIQAGQNLQDLQIHHDTTHLELSNCSETIALPELFNNSGHNRCLSTSRRIQHLNVLQNATLPACIAYLRSLRVLIADQCGLALLGPSLALQLRNLHTLSLNGNNLQWLPSWLSHMEHILDVLLVEDNPLHGDYAELVRPLKIRDFAQAPTIIHPAGLPMSTLAESVVSSKSLVPTLCEIYTKDATFGWTSSLPQAFPAPRDTRSHVSNGTDRLSMFGRARSFRGRMRRSSLTNRDKDTFDRNSVTRSSLVVPDALANLFPPGRSAALRSMKSTSDLVPPSPSLQSLIDSPDPAPSPFMAWRRARTGTNSPRCPESTDGTPELVHDTPFLSSEVSDTGESAADSDADDERPAKVNEMSRIRRPSFFRKMTNKLSKKRSMANLPVPDKTYKQAEAGSQLPPLPVFFDEIARTHSDPVITSRRARKASSRPHLMRGETSQAALPIHTLHVPTPRPEQPLSPGLLAPASFVDSTHAPSAFAAKRRSYLMLTSPLPKLPTPGPLTFNWASAQSNMDGPQAPSTGVVNIDEEETIDFSSTLSGQPAMYCADLPPATSAIAHSCPIDTALQRMILAPLLAYLRDLDDLLMTAEAAKLDVSGVLDHVRQPEGGSLPPSRIVSRKPSMVATSSASSVINRSSGYGSSKGDSTALKSPSMKQSSVTNTDDAVKRRHLVEEILSTEISYLRSLQELSALYIQPASAPIRTLGDVKTNETVISSSERKKVFYTIENITAYHAKFFLPALQEAAKDVTESRLLSVPLSADALQRSVQRVAQVFIQQAAFLKMYHLYCVNYDVASARVTTWKTFGTGTSTPIENQATSPVIGVHSRGDRALSTSEKKRIHKLLKNAATDARHTQMNLESYLLMPIQRIPRYRMLLEGLISCTPDTLDATQPDTLLLAAYNAIAAVAQEMNERKRDNEGRRRLLYWQKRLSQGSFPSTLVQAHRSLIREGEGTLSRVAKSAFTPVAIVHQINGTTSCYKLPYLNIEISQKRLVYLLCSDIFVLLEAPEDEAGPANLITVIRLGTHNNGGNLAGLFGAGSTLRIRDARAIFYVDMKRIADAVELRNLLNEADSSEYESEQAARA